ncbi:alpha-galactosidase [Micropruina sonneratiae]|uniref:alpha-galactosidase n=1 Tax=Micropruina sonneratiae TaxID=2986940 RepID=UPI0022274372|nr:alpha-galactosidase [Micropruina sp. KQZ13P-5]MCW3158050.1 alpha-galactosidase [Micropruina sp. KQZ13P-5]
MTGVALAAPRHDALTLQPMLQDLPNPYGQVTRCDLTATVNAGETDVSDLATVLVELAPGDWTAHWFSSDWGDEFTPRRQPLGPEPLELRNTTGRSSKGLHPWLALERGDGRTVVVTPAWSGNWRLDVEPAGAGFVVRAGISPWRFSRRVTPEQTFRAPTVYVSSAPTRADATAALAAAASAWVVPRTPAVPLTWNHWWPYEDREIDHDTFLANVEVARRLGYELAVLDAGWFGGADADSDWWRIRGDWDAENTVRFPAGVAGLARATREQGLQFGVWCEVEALGDDAAVAARRPEIVARRDEPGFAGAREGDPGWLGYVCLGSPAGRAHVLVTLDDLVARTGASWLKVDFNLDPGPGCSRTDHGHDAGDGLYEHYRGLYEVLDVLRDRHPQLIVEDCSSGGLRLDLGLLGHVHCGFLSDPDWTEFQLQLLWGVSQLLPAASIFHFSESQWRTFHPLQNLDPATIGVETFDASLRAVMLHRFALSLKLPELSAALRERVIEHAAVYREHVRPLLQEHGVIRPLTAQPRREGGGERWPAFQLTAPARAAHVVMAVALPGAAATCRLRPLGLAAAARYTVTLLGPGAPASDLGTVAGTGAELMTTGIEVGRGSGAQSWLLLIEPAEPPATPAGPVDDR